MNTVASTARARRVAGWAAVALTALMSAAIHAQTIPPQYVNALQRAQYQVFAGDVNSDGFTDVMAKSRKRIVLIDYDVPIPIPLNPASPTFILLSGAGGSYTLNANPSQTMINSSVWQPASHDLIFGDVLGTGSTALLLRGRTSGMPSFVIVTSASGQPVLSQHLSTATLGVDISGSTYVVSLTDTNRDGRADLVLRTSGLIQAVFAADPSGLFTAPDDDQDRVMMAWRASCTALDTGDIPSAQQFVVEFARQKYAQALTALGPSVQTLTSTLSEPREISTGATLAEYVLTQTYAGSTQVHLVVFRRSGSNWQLEAF